MPLVINQQFYQRDTLTVAKELLGKTFVRIQNGKRLSGIIVETEAYLQNDAACHASRGMTPRTKPMFEDGGISYVYFIYGMYYCLNVVTDKKDIGCAVLIRAIEPIDGIETMQKNRKQNSLHNLCSGPGKLAQAFSITKKQNKLPLTTRKEIWIENQGYRDPEIVTTTRIGISKDAHHPYRFYIKDNNFVSKL